MIFLTIPKDVSFGQSSMIKFELIIGTEERKMFFLSVQLGVQS